MPLHDCPYSFQELASDVLPGLMAKLRQHMEQPCSALVVLNDAGVIPDVRGAYVWLVGTKPIYVGIANRLRRRIKDHLCPDPSRANLAVRMAAKHLGVPISKAKRHPGFTQAFLDAQSTLAQARIAFVEVPNPLVLYLFEPFCAMALDTSEFNRFDTLQILSPRPITRVTS
ncbi:MAG: GIY-YIG nuclease family protein [Alicycliphilus sp.]|nr:GIY-YIG nuclease family protein [Alicycliphilus sp.]